MKKLLFTNMMLFTALSVVCYAGSIYGKARQAGIDLFNCKQYHKAAQQFIAVQNIAPINNDLSSWITKCHTKMVQRRNALIKKNKFSTVPNTQPIIRIGSKISKCDSVGKYGTANLALVRLNNQYGFIDKDSILIVPIQYDDVYSVITEALPGSRTDELIKAHNIKWEWSWDKGQLMSVCKDGKWGYINDKGQEVIPIVYDDVRESIVFEQRHLIGVGKDDKYGFIDWSGNIVIPLQYEYVSRFYQGVFFDTNELGYDMVPVVKNGKMGFIDNYGSTVIPFDYEPQYDLAYSVPVMFRPVWSDGVTYVKKNGKFGIIDLKGNSTSGFKYDGPGELELINVGGDYKSYYVFPMGNNKIYYFEGHEYRSEAEITQAIINK